MKTVLMFLMLFAAGSLFSQEVEYAYDSAGNRYQRKVVYLMYSMPSGTNVVETVNNLSVSLTPNPTTEGVSVTLTETNPNAIDDPTVYSLILYDNKGTLVSSQQLKGTNGFVNMRGMANGTYILNIVNEGVKKQVRIIKQ